MSAIEDLALGRLQSTCKDARRVLRMFDEKQLTLDRGTPPWRGNSNLVGTTSPTGGSGRGGSNSPLNVPQTAAGAANLCQALRSNLEQEVRVLNPCAHVWAFVPIDEEVRV